MTISGFFGDEDALFFEIELIPSDGLGLSVGAMLDTYVIQQKYIK